MEEKEMFEVIKGSKVGRFNVEVLKKGSYGSSRYFISVKRGQKKLFLSDEFPYRYDVMKKLKEVVEKYSKKEGREKSHKCLSRFSRVMPQTSDGYKMNRICLYCGKIIQKNVSVSTFEGFVRRWIHKELGKKTQLGHYFAKKDKLIYVGSGREVEDGTDVLALSLKDGRVIGNASQLFRCGSYRRGTEAPAQAVMFQLNMPMVPFNIFEEVKLNIQTAKVIDTGKEEDVLAPKLEWDEKDSVMKPVEFRFSGFFTKVPSHKNFKIISKEKDYEVNHVWSKEKKKKVRRKVYGFRVRYIDSNCLEERHFIGAMLIEVSGKQFLFDIDRNEIKNYRFNPFLAQLPRKVKTIKQAYELLKPKIVIEAEKKGLKVLRQGEWFFVPVNKDICIDLPKDIKKGLEYSPNRDVYDLGRWSCGVGIKIAVVGLKKMREFKMLKEMYKQPLLKRVEVFNKECIVYEVFRKREVAWKKDNQVFEYGGELKAGENRPNTVSNLIIKDKVHYCKGNVRHTGREHEDLRLTRWHIAVPNTAIKSFTITGNID